MVGHNSSDPRARAAAEAFGAPVIWGHPPPVEPGRTASFAQERGIPWLYTEARGAGRIHPKDLRKMRRGIRNLACHLGLLSGPMQTAPLRMRLCGNGNTDTGVTATRAAFC